VAQKSINRELTEIVSPIQHSRLTDFWAILYFEVCFKNFVLYAKETELWFLLVKRSWLALG
jgi:hypothetical protein